MCRILLRVRQVCNIWAEVNYHVLVWVFCVVVCARTFAMRYECSPYWVSRVIRSRN